MDFRPAYHRPFRSVFLDEHRSEDAPVGFPKGEVKQLRSFSHVVSPNYNLADEALSSALIGLNNVKVYSFLERGSDERQYCSPGIELPVCGFCRSKYGKYSEYHTNKDNFDVMTQKGLQDSFKVMQNIIDAFEAGIFPKTQTLGEPQLGKRKLYEDTDTVKRKRNRLNLLAYSNGKRNIFNICKKINQPLEEVLLNIKKFKKLKLLKTKYF